MNDAGTTTRGTFVRIIPSRLGTVLVLVLVLLCSAADGMRGQQPDRSRPPAPGTPPAFRMGPILRDTLASGLPVVLVEKHGVPVVQLNLLIRTGYACDPVGRAGVASMTASMMMEGAGTRDALALADAVEYLGARLTVNADYHVTGIRLHTSVARLDSALSIMGDVVLRPAFPSGELERKKRERLTTLLQWRDEPTALASVQFNRTLYGDVHPYGVSTMGNEQTIRSLSVEDLRKFHADWFTADRATLIIVGDVQPAAMHAMLERVFGTWQKGSKIPPELPGITQVSGRRIELVDKPGAAQTQIRLGRIGVPRTTRDYYAITVMNTILGGSFASRLNQNLREKHGYTYGASSRFMFRLFPGPFVAASAVQTAVTDKALGEFMKELNAIREPVPATEVERAKNYVALGFPGDFQTVAQIAGQLEDLVAYQLPDDYFNTYIERILAVTAADVERVAKQYIDPANITIVLVGDRSQIGTPVSALSLGTVVALTIEDVLGKAPIIDNP